MTNLLHPDENLWEAIQRSEEWAYEVLFKRYYAPLAGYANTIIQDRDHSEGLAQEVFVKVWEKRSDLSIQTSIKSYLYRAIFNKCLNVKKHYQVRADYQLSHAGDSVVNESSITNFELKYKIQEALDKLPEQCRKIFKMSKIEGLKYAEIAEELNISVKTVENQMGKALKLMRKYLQEFALFILAIIKIWMD